jgi:hypothetical protein
MSPAASSWGTISGFTSYLAAAAAAAAVVKTTSATKGRLQLRCQLTVHLIPVAAAAAATAVLEAMQAPNMSPAASSWGTISGFTSYLAAAAAGFSNRRQ